MKRALHIITFIAGCLIFGMLMAWRGELTNIFVRALVAALAGAALALAIALARHARANP